MTKDKRIDNLKNKISMALKDTSLQLGFEIICKKLVELEKENAELKDKLNNLASVAEVRLGMWQKYEKENAELKKESNQLFLEGAKRVEELEAQIEKMKCCANCKYCFCPTASKREKDGKAVYHCWNKAKQAYCDCGNGEDAKYQLWELPECQ